MTQTKTFLILCSIAIAFLAGLLTNDLLQPDTALAQTKSTRLTEPRLAPVAESEWTDEQRAILEPLARGGRLINIFPTLAHHPRLLERWLVFGGYILRENTLPPRDRELLILRTGWLCQAEYEFGQHTLIGKGAGLTDADIRRITTGPGATGWSKKEQALLRAADELRADAFITDATWDDLAQHYTTQQLMDLVFTVGQYNLVSMALNTLGVQLDEGVPGFPGRD